MINENAPDVDASGAEEGVPREVEADLDGMIAQMQSPTQRRGVDALFRLSGKELGEAAHRAASSRS